MYMVNYLILAKMTDEADEGVEGAFRYPVSIT
jgi:hypothetical protein